MSELATAPDSALQQGRIEKLREQRRQKVIVIGNRALSTDGWNGEVSLAHLLTHRTTPEAPWCTLKCLARANWPGRVTMDRLTGVRRNLWRLFHRALEEGYVLLKMYRPGGKGSRSHGEVDAIRLFRHEDSAEVLDHDQRLGEDQARRMWRKKKLSDAQYHRVCMLLGINPEP